MTSLDPARSYNQNHVPRPYSRGRRRVSIYLSWSFPGEANRDVDTLDDRYSTMVEVRRALWPAYEAPRFADPLRFQQGIAGSLELFFWAWRRFQGLVAETTGHGVPVFQRVDQAGFDLPLDERVLGDADTLLLFGLDHTVSGQTASPAEVEAVRAFLDREGTCLVLGPHHDVGDTPDLEQREVEYLHHGDVLVPRQQRFGGYTRSLMEGLGIPVQNRWGLRPALAGPRSSSAGGEAWAAAPHVAPLTIARDLDVRGWLAGVDHFNFHRHLPHYQVIDDGSRPVHVLATQPIDGSRPHPFIDAGNREFNALVWLPPAGRRAGDVLVVDSTVFSTLFGGDESLERFWRNLATAQ